MADFEESYKRALENVERLVAQQKNYNDLLELGKKTISEISTDIFGISGQDWLAEVPLSTEELKKNRDAIQANIDKINEMGISISEALKADKSLSTFANGLDKVSSEAKEKYLTNLKEIYSKAKKLAEVGQVKIDTKVDMGDIKALENALQKMRLEDGKLADINANQQLESLEEQFRQKSDAFEKELEENESITALKNQGLSSYAASQAIEIIQKGDYNKLLEEGNEQLIEALYLSGNINDENYHAILRQREANKALEQQNEELKKTKKITVDIGQGFKKIAINFLGEIYSSLKGFDSAMKKAQMETGIMFTQNSKAFANLTMSTAQFGMSLEETAQLMGDLGEELQTTDFGVLSKAAEDFKAIQKATGITSKDLAKIAGEMMRAGRSSKDVEKFIAGANVQAKKFGVSSKVVLQDIANNLDKMRLMGFVGGEESLAKMAAMARNLNIQVDDIFDVAQRARTIEGAMTMAADLQLAAGSFANINPMDLLAAARKGPDEMGKILTSMGEDIGHFNEKGEYKFDPVDVDRLQIVADATGLTLDKIQKLIQANAEKSKKLNLLPPSLLNVTDEQKEFLMSMTKIGEGGKIEASEELKKLAKDNGINLETGDLSQLNDAQVKQLMDLQAKEAARLEEQAKQNQSFEEATKIFKQTLMSSMVALQPLLEKLTKGLQFLGDIIQWFSKNLGAMPTAIILALTLGAGIFIAMLGKFMVTNAAKNFASRLLGGGAGGGGIGAGGPGGGGGLPGAGMKAPGAGVGEGIKGFLTGLADGLKAFGGENSPKILQGAATLAASVVLIGGALALVTLAFAALGGDFKQLVMFGLALVELGLAFFLMSKIKVDLGGLAMMALAMLIVGVALIPFAIASQMFAGVDWMSVLAAVGILTLVIIGFALIGSALASSGGIVGLFVMVAGLIGIAMGLLIFAGAMLVFGKAMQQLTTIPWDALTGMGTALLSVIPGLMAFAAAGIFFINPLLMMGFILMIANLWALAAVMDPLSRAFSTGGEGMDRFIAGLERLQTAVDKLDMAKLQELKNTFEGFAMTAVLGGVAESIGKVADSIGGGKGKEKEGETIHVVVQLDSNVLFEAVEKRANTIRIST